jgi:hypothetical protein
MSDGANDLQKSDAIARQDSCQGVVHQTAERPRTLAGVR